MTLHVVFTGEVDHGKSTILGRLLHDTGHLSDGKLDELEELCSKRGIETEWSFLLDSFQAERDQAVTIDTTQLRFRTKKRDYVLIDAPGHREFLRNMVSGTAQADAAVLVIDAAEGIREQTLRHAQILPVMGIGQKVVVINKMDAVSYDRKIFEKISREISEILEPAAIIPMAARDGEMIFNRGKNLDWYKGLTLVEALDNLRKPEQAQGPLRFAVQDVYRLNGRRIIVGRVESGVLRKGSEMIFAPYNQRATVESIEVWPENMQKDAAFPGECIGIAVSPQIFAERGMRGAEAGSPPMLSAILHTKIALLGDKIPQAGDNFFMRIGTLETRAAIQSLDNVSAGVAEVTLRTRNVVPFDPGVKIILYDESHVIGCGMIGEIKAANIRRVDHFVDYDARAELNGHKSGIFWFTGLSGAGKSTIAMAIEKALFDRGRQVYVLDGDNIRHGLTADLGFSPSDRAENVRWVAETAALMADAGMIVLAAFISPYKEGRKRARAAAAGQFYEIFVQADLPTCESRDPKGLYKKARAGEITGFTGIDSPYETPENPDLVIDTQINDVEECVRQVLEFIEQKTALPQDSPGKEKILAVQ